ncbi:GH92 family glycosyl hydrolase [Formosa algae]|uniref:Alpha-1,2-mannosidase n=1 Tax=Formosa algae TaxID=225843 RepID=A0A9X1CCA4_9FLAO|nr:GH92 family glycosyl hydrolase [Formosa algae]MBP1840050.1 putative alpha-1,2-mannosidase [Formosa algae]MDQ0335650.1 putative alpha-1,2-mannosidase [Formosa algae]OEI78714.1 alpha-mannosidase [Formosa algae]
MKKKFLMLCALMHIIILNAQEFSNYVNPFIGTSNFGATNPGAIAPRGMASVSPFNVAGSQNTLEKDSRWLSNPYVNENTFLTGYSHVNLSGVGCPDLGVILFMPTSGALETNHLKYGSTYTNEVAKAGYYSNVLSKYNIKVETTATTRTGVSRYTFLKGESNILLNLGLGLTNEEGASVKIVSATEIEGMRSVGSFCYYKPEEAYPVYFVAKFSEPAEKYGVWKTARPYKGAEAEWMVYNGKPRIMEGYQKEVVGDSIGSYFSYNFDKPTQVEVKVGISYVSIENARENLEKETQDLSFDDIYNETATAWDTQLSKIKVEGGSQDDKVIFYTALYHSLIHPNILNDYNGDYPKMATRETLNTTDTRFTVFSFWDTYRNLHALMSLVYPKQQSNMVKSMLDIYDESGWLPKWELNATETTTMVGDPAGIILTDTYLKGIKDFDIEKAYEAMVKSADALEDNPLRPNIETYINKGYLTSKQRGAVSTTQEYNATDFSIALLAKALDKKDDYKRFSKRAVSYRKLFDKNLMLLRPRNADGSFYEPFDPLAGANFTENIGFIEGNAWQYAFMVSHDIKGLMKLMGGQKAFSKQLQTLFNTDQFDMANEPDIAYPFLFNYVKGEEWRAQQKVQELIKTYFQNKPAGLPGNDDTGTMSAWLIYSMMGIYPVSPGEPLYTITTPVFDKITIALDQNYYEGKTLVIEKVGSKDDIVKTIQLNGKAHKSYFINHSDLIKGSNLKITTD